MHWLSKWRNAHALVKGYGDTHVRGKPEFRRDYERRPETAPYERRCGAALKKLREAALADDTGEKLAAGAAGGQWHELVHPSPRGALR